MLVLTWTYLQHIWRLQPRVGSQVAILDAENRPVPLGKIGEVCSRGPNVTKGYLNNPAANKEAFAGKSMRLEL